MQELNDSGAFVKLFPQFSEEDCEYLINNSRIFYPYNQAQCVCREGEYGDTSFAIMKGEVEIFYKCRGP